MCKGLTKTKADHIQQRLQLKSSDTCMVGISMFYIPVSCIMHWKYHPTPRLRYSMHGLFERKHCLHKINHHILSLAQPRGINLPCQPARRFGSENQMSRVFF